MDRNPLISVITVVFNGSRHIESTIESVMNQSYPRIEYMIIDGASVDGTQDIIRKYQHKLGYWLSEPDSGLYDAMNKGLKASHGEYVIFLNSGDRFYNSDSLQEVFKNEEADVYYGETMFMNGEGKDLGTRSQLTSRKLPDQLTYKSFMKGMVVSHQAFIVRRTLAPLFELQYACSSDINWCITVLKRSNSNVRMNGILVRYLTQGFSIQNRKKCLMERFRIFINQFGLVQAILIHIYILIRYFYYKLIGRPNY